MSTIELLKQVKALPPRERQKFVLAILTLEEGTGQAKAKAKPVKWPDGQARARRIFEKRVMPNLVLLEREEAAF